MKATQLLRFNGASRRDPGIEAWMENLPSELKTIAEYWFSVMRTCGADVRELLHDGHPTACVGDAAFGYVNAFKTHVNVGFFRGAELSDPERILEGTGRYMRHVKIRPSGQVSVEGVTRLVQAAHADMQRRVLEEWRG